MTARGSQWLLPISFVVVVSGFVAGDFFTEMESHSISRAADGIATNALPSLRELTLARSELRLLPALIANDHAYLNRPPWSREIRESLARLDQYVSAYLTLPTYPGEAELQPEIRRRIRQVRAAIEVRAGVSELEAAILSADKALVEASNLNRIGAEAQVRQIRATRRKQHVTAIVVDALGIVLTAIVGLIVVDSMRRSARLDLEREQFARVRSEELEQFAGRMAHDVVSPLSGAVLHLGEAERRCKDSDVREAIVRARNGILRVRPLVDGLLEFAHAGAHPPPGVNTQVAPVMDNVIGELQPAARAVGERLIVEPFAPAAVAASPAVLTSLLSNLLRNAVKYTSGSPIRIITVRVLRYGAVVRFEVEDTGPGVSRDIAAQLFNPYFRGPTAGQPGVGLGLATVKRFAESHGGTAGVESTVGRGSCFWFELPAASNGDLQS